MATINLNDIVGQTFGKLTILSFDSESKKGTPRYICKCTCGNTFSKIRKDILNGKNLQCKDCYNKSRSGGQDIVGQKFGRWYVESFARKEQAYRSDGSLNGFTYYYNCICECGNRAEVAKLNLTSGKSKSCGCLNQEALQDYRTRILK